ncbi:YceI family protein [Sediminibacterium ginsengisoli]|uniref:Polyisoprenoid-binding protein YceI n=1 Tax=Sediminibacterium ginsengisoli TaxID=413434 RepID=A0A1T4QQE1_9BACT|nr:YceI family protein [Sediminibacterium ginsengisoli]SKA05896.1 Polyisoprenoid-binding protein YceI [Sediminibacterium ginsengisoli]
MKKTLFALAGMALLMGIYSFVPKADTYNVNVDKSRIDWIASKKNDFHTGAFPLKSGQVVLEGNKLKGGKFVIDLANLKVTDAAGDRLAGHLKNADFFDVAKFNEATYEITGVNYTSDNTAALTGNLVLKGASFPVNLTANIRNADDKAFFAEAFFSLDRTALGITYNGPSKDVQMAVHIFANK